MEAIFSEKEIMALQSQTWWTACSENPFLIKSSILETTILLSKSDLMKVITDLKIMWATRIDKTTLLMQKQIYAKTLEVKDFMELIHLFETILTNPDEKALYEFIKKKNNSLCFKVQKQISVYPFSWKFDLMSVEYDIVAMLCKQIVNPMTKALNAQEKRYNIMKTKMENMQRQLMRKMTEVQKNYYKSPLNEDQNDLKLLVSQPRENEFISSLRLQSTSKFFFEKSLLVSKSTTASLLDKGKEKTKKVEKRVLGYMEQSGEELLNEIEMKKKEQLEKKKKKKIDFL